MIRDSMVFYRSFMDSAEHLEAEQYKNFIQSILHYAMDGTVPELKGIELALFKLVKPQIDANVKRYENGCKGGKYGKLGGRPKNESPTKPQDNPSKTPNDNVNVNENDNVNANLFLIPGFEDAVNKTIKKYPRHDKYKTCIDLICDTVSCDTEPKNELTLLYKSIIRYLEVYKKQNPDDEKYTYLPNLDKWIRENYAFYRKEVLDHEKSDDC